MPLPLAVLLAATTPDPAYMAALCAVGRQVLVDLPEFIGQPRGRAFHASDDAIGRTCPALRDAAPGLPPADADARARAGNHALSLPPGFPHATIYAVGVPAVSEDLRTATIYVSQQCSGLCGGSFALHYARDGAGWRRVGGMEVMSVS